MTEPWTSDTPKVITLPSGRRVRGRGLRHELPEGQTPTLAVHLTRHEPPEVPWESLWIPWRDFWLPAEPRHAMRTLRIAYDRALDERVEICCGGGVGRTGTALSALCVFEGMAPEEAVRWVRRTYHSRAVEVPWQRRFVRQVSAARVASAQ
ncbi:protein phosphatase [Streptomyces sp. XM83C]|jgi:protein-tyrosine phosphatase|uniref:Protein-tyrosine phosphatase family protein n=1 Tax=Streptomyces thermocoprophilus TaxID=78356 RepID=A0ABV5VIC4_9ACTN|nr:protein-tyrosine phosphatase family protein [Streptomyces sp. XM83C]MCK1820928.1 protein phosphatase [Streptomyces sp. XM83C]